MNRAVILLLMLLSAYRVCSQTDTLQTDSIRPAAERPMKTIHRLAVDVAPGGIFHTNQFLIGNNPEQRTMNHASSLKLSYAFQPAEGTWAASVYRDSYQGLGLALHEFNPQLSNPVSVYMFQGARIATLARYLSLNYEWNLGLTFGWNPYDEQTNPDNRVIGSRVTAYIDADLYFSYRLARCLNLNAGVALSHFSNGNTSYPNAGLNTWGARVGLAWYLNRPGLAETYRSPSAFPFERHISYDVVLFGAWRRCGVLWDDGTSLYAVPGSFGVYGLNVNPMYNINHWFNAGLSLDYVYDRSTNLYFPDNHLDMDKITAPSAGRQMALGLSARAEFVMPYFSINMGIGRNFVNGTGDFSGFYEMLALKIHVFKAPFIHIGYCLSDFRYPNYLMLGLGYTFNYKRRF